MALIIQKKIQTKPIMIQTLNLWLKYVRQQNHNKNYDEKYNPENVHEYQLKHTNLVLWVNIYPWKVKKYGIRLDSKLIKKETNILHEEANIIELKRDLKQSITKRVIL